MHVCNNTWACVRSALLFVLRVLFVKCILPYSDKRKQLLKNDISRKWAKCVVYMDINTISLYIDLNIFQQDEWFLYKLGMEVEYAN